MNPTLDIAQARFNMIEQQIRPWDVLDQDVLDLLEVVRREDFVPPAQRLLAFTDMEIPLEPAAGPTAGNGAAMWSPKMEARVLQELQVKAHDKALEIGAGSGYFAALLAHRCRDVTSVEFVPALKSLAEKNLKAAGAGNVKVVAGDGAQGFGRDQYEVIVLSGSTPAQPDALLAQLSTGGRLFAVVGDAPAMTARIYTRTAQGIAAQDLFETVLTPLVNAAQPPRFKF
jgi:protein-L-isoaspartate(D-aspartate) O-methyltransferase